LVIGVLAQVVLGGIVVLTGLHPLANMGHFALSMVLVANALVLVRRSAQPDGGCPVRTVDPSQNRLIRLVVVLGTMAVVTGTVVTGTGPHAGDEEAPRFGFDISHVARIHGIAVIATLVACLALAVKLRRNLVHKAPVTALEGVVAIGFVQAAIGYVQYFNGVPALLVGFHILGATLFFLALVNLWTSATQIVDNRDNVARNSVMV
jgi:cytochrome c oxidase assembly protein subunit 15